MKKGNIYYGNYERTKNGGPAFPLPVDDDRDCRGLFESGYGGMTLRDYFAAKAMQGLLAAQIHGFNDSPANGPFARLAYEMADAMLKTREGNGE